MASPATLSRIRLMSRLCRRGAWVIAAVGTVVICIIAVALYNLFSQGPDQSTSDPHLNQLFVTLAIALLMALPIAFFALILSALGAWLDYVYEEKETRVAEDDEEVEITALPEYEEVRKL